MKKKMPDHDVSCGNVFADAGLPNAREHMLKARLVSRIENLMEERRLSQTQAADIMGLAQPDLSNILHGRFRDVSMAWSPDGLQEESFKIQARRGLEFQSIERHISPGRRHLSTRAFPSGWFDEHPPFSGLD